MCVLCCCPLNAAPVDLSKVILGVSSPVVISSLKHHLQSGLGGILLIGNSWKNTKRTTQFIKTVKSIHPDILICIDQEGGTVTRLKFKKVTFPSAQTIGKYSSVYDAHRLGLQNGHYLKSIGIDINFAPVLDVLTATQNHVIGSRSFGSDPDHVAQLGIAYMNGLMDAGIIPVIKHFPGHGDTTTDSHYDLPTNNYPMRYLEMVPIKPFYSAIQHHAPAVMMSHIIYPAKDIRYPASLSKLWVSYLRNDLGFNGLIITDDLSMKAISRYHDQKNAITLALNAGVDYVIITGGLPIF